MRADDADTQIAVTFVSNDAPKMHGGFGGSTKYNSDTNRFENPTPYKYAILHFSLFGPR